MILKKRTCIEEILFFIKEYFYFDKDKLYLLTRIAAKSIVQFRVFKLIQSPFG